MTHTIAAQISDLRTRPPEGLLAEPANDSERAASSQELKTIRLEWGSSKAIDKAPPVVI